MITHYNGIYRAKVLATDSAEDDNLGRIKVEVYPMLIGIDTAKEIRAYRRSVGVESSIDGIETANLPWAVPAYSLFAGSGNGYGSFAVPEIDSYVWVFFEAGDVYQPVYFAEAPTKTYGIPSESATNYPYNKVIKTKNGISVQVNDSAKSITVTHPEGTIINIDGSGNVSIASAGTTTITSSGNLSVSAPRIDLN